MSKDEQALKLAYETIGINKFMIDDAYTPCIFKRDDVEYKIKFRLTGNRFIFVSIPYSLLSTSSINSFNSIW